MCCSLYTLYIIAIIISHKPPKEPNKSKNPALSLKLGLTNLVNYNLQLAKNTNPFFFREFIMALYEEMKSEHYMDEKVGMPKQTNKQTSNDYIAGNGSF